MQKRAEKKSVKAFERELKEAKAKENEVSEYHGIIYSCVLFMLFSVIC